MGTSNTLLNLIDDNPYNPRKHYGRNKVDEMAHSLAEFGQIETPKARQVDGRVQIASGHLRKRALDKLHKKSPDKFTTMRLEVEEISDEDMFFFALEENLQRHDITPMEIARSIDAFLILFPEEKEEGVAKKFKMTQGNVSNMRRVLRLPEKVLEKVDTGRITFTQARELIVLERLASPEEMMLTAIRGTNTEGRSFGHANTVEGMQASAHDVVRNHCRPLDKQWEGHRWTLIFDTRAAGCLECNRMVRTHPSKSTTAHFCIDEVCWDRHQEEQRVKAAAEAKAKMEADVLARAAAQVTESAPAPENISQEISELPTELREAVTAFDRGTEQVATAAGAGVVTGVPVGEAEEHTVVVTVEKYAEVEASYSGDTISKGNIRKPFPYAGGLYIMVGSVSGGNRAPESRVYGLSTREEFEGEIRAYEVSEQHREDPMGFYHGILVMHGKSEWVMVGPEFTFTTGEIPAQPPAASAEEQEVSEDIKRRVESAPAPDTGKEDIPEDILALAREKAGTRAEVLDIRELQFDQWNLALKAGYAVLKGGGANELHYLDDPEECLERCTHGFHYAFSSRDTRGEGITYNVCSDPQCLGKKKGAFTRAKNAEGQARKKAETKAVKEAIAATKPHLDRPRIKLILLAQMKGAHTTRGYYGETRKETDKWLWDKVSAGTPDNDRNLTSLFKKIDKLSDEELAKLTVEFMFYFLVDHGDIGTYQIKAEDPLKWMGISIELGGNGAKEPAGAARSGKGAKKAGAQAKES